MNRSALVAITGIDGSGKGYLTAKIASALQPQRVRVATINIDGWLNLPHIQERGSDYGAMAGPLGVEFTITAEKGDAMPSRGMHLCFRAPDRAAVHAFHATAVVSGGRGDGDPGLRPEYHRDYFAAFVLDPDGHRIEAVCHAPKSTTIV